MGDTQVAPKLLVLSQGSEKHTVRKQIPGTAIAANKLGCKFQNTDIILEEHGIELQVHDCQISHIFCKTLMPRATARKVAMA